MRLRLKLKHKKDGRESFYELTNIDAGEISNIYMYFGLPGLIEHVKEKSGEMPAAMKNFKVTDWEFA